MTRFALISSTDFAVTYNENSMAHFFERSCNAISYEPRLQCSCNRNSTLSLLDFASWPLTNIMMTGTAMSRTATTMPAMDTTYDALPRYRAALTAWGSLDSWRRANTAVHYNQNTQAPAGTTRAVYSPILRLVYFCIQWLSDPVWMLINGMHHSSGYSQKQTPQPSR